ncbi:MAG: beta-glucuronidase [Acidimicrobiales bacterium]
MLRPQDNGIRETRALDGLWRFAPDPAGVGRREQWWRHRLPGERFVPVPASYNDIFTEEAIRDLVGDAWYQRRLFVPAGWSGARIVLRFDAATHRALVWVDDEQVVTHEGGYTPFEADITGLARAGEELRITVVVNNELSFATIPPGVVRTRPDGTRQQQYFHDFFNYAGLPRHVWLSATPTEYIADLTVVTDLDGDPPLGVVDYRVETGRNGTVGPEPGPDLSARVTLRDADGVTVSTGVGPSGRLMVPDVRPWQPGDGYRYDLTVELVRGDETVDRYHQPVGIRTVRVDGARFLINGRPFTFRGFGMHEDHLVRGKGHEAVSMIHDFELLDWIGANSLRTSHYPYAEEVLDEADRRGIVVIDETAAVGLNMGVGAGFFGGGPKTTFADGIIDEVTQAAHRQAILELITRDKNHPSVVLWSIANEPESHTEEAERYFAPLFAEARRADPSRPVGFVNVMLAPHDRCRVSALSDVIMLNRYYGWYVDSGDLDAAEAGLDAELRGWAERHHKPIIVTEYGADTISGYHALRPVPWTEEYQVELLDRYHRVFDRIDAVVGEHVWNFADFETRGSFMRVGGNKKGVFARDRTPKAAAGLLRRRWRAPDRI